jgi:VCBS repeat-containing protein
LSVEQLESIEAAGSLMLSTAGLAAVAVVRTAETHTPTPIAEKPAGIADWSQEASTEAERALSDRIFNLTTARNDASSEVYRFLTNTDSLSSADDEESRRTADDNSLDSVMAAGDALVDPVSHLDDAAKANPHHAVPPSGNGLNTPPPTLAGAGQGPGGASTPFAPGGGNSSGGGGGGANGNQLAQLGNLGLFSPQSAAGSNSSTMPAALTPMQPLSAGPDSSPSTLGGIRPLLLGSPVANNDNYTLLHDSTLSVPASAGVLANDTDPNNLPLSAVLVSTTTHGSLALNSDGSFVYTANAGYTGSDSFQYYATDGQANSNTATVTFTVNDPNAPVAVADSYSGLHDQVLSVDAGTGVLANDSDADGDTLTAALVAGSGPTHGTLQLGSDGSFTYTPNAGYVGADSFQYKASDGVLSSAATTVSLSVTDNAPTAINHSYGIPENMAESVTAASGLLNGAADADNDPLTASLVGGSGPSHGSVTVNSDGSFSYTPNSGYTGSDSFQYKVSDGALSSTATVSLTVHATDTAPTANAATYTVLHDQVLTETAAQGVLSHASDADNDPLTASLVNGTGPTHGTLTFNNDGSFTYTPNAGYSGSDSFQYQVSDGQLTSSAATVTLTINDPNAPVAVADSYSVERNNEFDADASTGVLANDTDTDGDTLTASLATGPSHGTLTFNSDGSFSYVPSSNYTGTDTFTYTASDGVQSSAPATVTLTISGSAPVANNDTYQTLENHQLFLDGPAVLGNDFSPDNMPLTSVQLTQPAHGTATLTSSGSISYTPNSNYVGTDSFTYEDSDGSLTSNTATITINVKASDTAPTASNLSYTLAHDSSLSTDSGTGLLSGASDSDGDTLFPLLMGMPTHGTLQFTPYGDGSFTYTPNAGFSGTDSFSFEVSDGIANSNMATVTLTVTNDAPTANPDSYSVLSSGATSISADNGVLANDTDGEGDALTAVLVSQPAHGSVMLNSDGSFTFTPNGFTGSDSFTYKAYDGVNYSSPVTVTLTSGPVAAAQEYGVNHDTPLSVDAADGLLNGAVDADGDPLTAAFSTGPSHGSVTVNSDGSFTYTPATHFTGTDSFTFTVSDGTNTSAPATVAIDVTDDVPAAGDGAYSTPENQALTVTASAGVLANASDDDGDAVTVQLVSGTSNGTLQLGSNGAFTYTPNSSFFGTDSFTYDVTDGVSTSAPATVTIGVDQVFNMSGSQFQALAAADFNDDGNLDVAAADSSAGTVTTFLGDGAGNFTQQSVTSVGSDPVALAVGDFNGDGRQDLAVANSGSNSVSILLGNGDGTFTAGTTLTNFNDPVAVVAGDFNGDGKTDLAVVNEAANTVSILLGNGNGTFTASTAPVVGNQPDAIGVADLNGDGKEDLVVANAGSNTVSVLLGHGDGTFAAAVNYAVGSAPSSLALGDVDGDGVADLVVANKGSNNVSVLIDNGDGTFATAVNYAAGASPVAVALGDYYGQGSLSISVADQGSNQLTVLLNSGLGSFFPAQTIPLAGSPSALVAGAFTNDGGTEQLASSPLTFIPKLVAPPPPPVDIVQFSPVAAAQTLAVMNARGAVILYQYGNPKPSVTILDPGFKAGAVPSLNAMAYSSNGRYLVVSRGPTVQVWDLTKPKAAPAKYTYVAGPGGGPPPEASSLAFEPGTSNLDMGDTTGAVQVWDVTKAKPGAPVRIGGATVSAMAISPNGRFTASSVGRALHFIGPGGRVQNYGWINRAGNRLVTWGPLAFSPKGDYLAAATDDNTILVMPIVNNQLGKPQILRAGPRPVTSLGYGPNFIVAGNVIGQVRVWTHLVVGLPNGLPIPVPFFLPNPGLVFAAPPGAIVNSVAVSPNGKLTAIGGDDIEPVPNWNPSLQLMDSVAPPSYVRPLDWTTPPP